MNKAVAVLFLIVVLGGCAPKKQTKQPVNYAEMFHLSFPAQRPSIEPFLQQHPLASQLRSLMPDVTEDTAKQSADYILRAFAFHTFYQLLGKGTVPPENEQIPHILQQKLAGTHKETSSKVFEKLIACFKQAQADATVWVKSVLPVNPQQIQAAHIECNKDALLESIAAGRLPKNAEEMQVLTNMCYEKTIKPFTWPLPAERDMMHEVFVVRTARIFFPPAPAKAP